MPGPTFGFVKLLGSLGSHYIKWADEQHRPAGFESRLVPDLPLPFISTLIGLQAFDLVSSPVWWEAATNIQRSVIKFLVVVKCKPCEIYKRMYHAYRETCFSQEMFTNWLKMCCLQRACVKKTVYVEETQGLPGKEKILDSAVSKEGHADYLLKHKRTHHYWFPCATVNRACNCQLYR